MRRTELLVAFVLVAMTGLLGSCSEGGRKDVSARQSRQDYPVWTRKSGGIAPPGRAYASFARDPATGNLVLFGGTSNGKNFNDTWTFDGTTWLHACGPGLCASNPPERQAAVMAPDPSGKLVLYGGCKNPCSASSDFYQDTWIWDGASKAWQSSGATGPQAVSHAAMAYDPTGNKTVLFGGFTSLGGLTAQTWSWNGSTWSNACPSGCGGLPPSRSHHGMAYEKSAGRLLTYGGYNSSGNPDTWALKWAAGAYTWSQITGSGAIAPGGRAGYAMASDPSSGGPLVMFGGNTMAGPVLGDAWKWNGTGWDAVTMSSPAPQLRTGASLGYLGGSTGFVLVGGVLQSDTTGYGDIWASSSPGAWVSLGMSSRYGHGMAYDPVSMTTLMFGGYDGALRSDLWSWDGALWTRRLPTVVPTATAFAGVALQESGGKLVVVGGGEPTTITPGLAESWSYDTTNNAWTRECLDTTCVFPWLFAPGMVYDNDRDCLVLYGGISSGGVPIGRIFERCGGGTWQEVCTSAACKNSRPPDRFLHAMAYDRNRHRTVVVGGCLGDCSLPTTWLSDTWEWDGSQWHLGPAGPPALHAPTMAYDTRRKKVVLMGGNSTNGTYDAVVYEYDGTTWSAYSDASGATAREAAGAAYDRQRGVIVFHAGAAQANGFGDTWETVSWGGTCTTNNDCDDGYPCVSGFCCSTACNGLCNVCAAALGAPADGTCGLAHRGYVDPNCPNGYVCGGAGVTCLTSCAGDGDCQTTYYCNVNGLCQPSESLGAACNKINQCRDPDNCRLCGSLACVDSVCCATACAGLCEHCTAGTGQCDPIPDGADPINECGDVAGTCGVKVCNGARVCRYVGIDTSCGNQTCSDGTLTLAASCDGNGACSTAPTQGCNGFACNASNCGTTCTPNTHTGCISGFTCNDAGGACIGGGAPGDSCTGDGHCASNVCADGKCCSGPCDHTDPSCGGKCDHTGACSYPGTDQTCTNGAGQTGHCLGNGLCDAKQVDAGTPQDGAVGDGGGDARQDAAPDAPVGDGAASDAAGQQDGAAPQDDAGTKKGTTSFLGCSAAPAAGASTLPLLLIGLLALYRRR